MTTIQERLATIEALMARFYDHDRADEAVAAAQRGQDDFKAWQKERGAALDASAKAFDGRLAEYEAAQNQLDLAKRNLETARQRLPVAEYNAEVEKYNQRVQRGSQLGQELRAAQDRHNAEVAAFQTEQESRMRALEELQGTANREALGRARWQQGDGPAELWGQINQLYAEVRNLPPSTGGEDGEPVARRLRAIRKTLGERAQAEQRTRSAGVLFERCRLGRRVGERDLAGLTARQEEAFMVVDPAATVCAITPEMVKILQLERLQDDEVELSLPNNIRVRAPQILLPVVEAGGHAARFVECVVLRESMPGIDGTLGLSFLNKFEYRLTKDTDGGGAVPALSLTVPEERSPARPGTFDVFICHKTEDRPHAEVVYEELRKQGKRPFLSVVCLEREADFGQKIESAIEAAEHLVVVTSSRQHAEAPWVRREWRIFEELMLGGDKKESNIVTVMCGAMNEHQLPLPLRRFQAISMRDGTWPALLMRFLPSLASERRTDASCAK